VYDDLLDLTDLWTIVREEGGESEWEEMGCCGSARRMFWAAFDVVLALGITTIPLPSVC
jgi:hypothetical protein